MCPTHSLYAKLVIKLVSGLGNHPVMCVCVYEDGNTESGIKSKPLGGTTDGSGGPTKSSLARLIGSGEPGADNGFGFGTVELTFSPETNYLARPAVTMHHGDRCDLVEPQTDDTAFCRAYIQYRVRI